MTDINVGQFSEALNDKADRDLQNIRENTKTVDPLYSGIGYFDLSFSGISAIPFQVRVYLVCKSAEAGYSEGEQTEAFGFGDYSSHLILNIVQWVVQKNLSVLKEYKPLLSKREQREKGEKNYE